MPAIFISYRREDSIAYSGRLYERLVTEFGKSQVFMDIDSIDPGADFVEVIEQTVASCDAVLVVIGRHWLTVVDAQGRRRLENPEDFVRLEVGTALSRKVRVVPILVGGAQMPRSDELPGALAGLSRRNALELRDVGFHQTLGRLIDSLRRDQTKVLEHRKPEHLVREAEARGEAKIAGQTKVNPKDGLTYVWIPPGTFTMGCSPGDSECLNDEKPAHQVTITTGFWIGQTLVTVAAWKRYRAATGKPALVGADRYSGLKLNEAAGDDTQPAVAMTWDEARSFCEWSAGRLPTEAEWEYAARAGGTTHRYGSLDAIAWFGDNSGKQRIDSAEIWRTDKANYHKRLFANGNGPHPVGRKQPNAWNLHDMLGNVLEWTADWYTDNYSGNSETDPHGPTSGQYRVQRGGGWHYDPSYVRVSYRYRDVPEGRYTGVGFRCVGS